MAIQTDKNVITRSAIPNFRLIIFTQSTIKKKASKTLQQTGQGVTHKYRGCFIWHKSEIVFTC